MPRRAPGALEAEVMGVLWAADAPLSPEQVRQQLGADLAYTTVMTILVRLVDKGAVERQAQGRGYVYAPRHDESGLAAERMRTLLEGEADPAGVLSRFVDGLDAGSVSALRRALGRRGGHSGLSGPSAPSTPSAPSGPGVHSGRGGR